QARETLTAAKLSRHRGARDGLPSGVDNDACERLSQPFELGIRKCNFPVGILRKALTIRRLVTPSWISGREWWLDFNEIGIARFQTRQPIFAVRIGHGFTEWTVSSTGSL